jgi:hypothetical protein
MRFITFWPVNQFLIYNKKLSTVLKVFLSFQISIYHLYNTWDYTISQYTFSTSNISLDSTCRYNIIFSILSNHTSQGRSYNYQNRLSRSHSIMSSGTPTKFIYTVLYTEHLRSSHNSPNKARILWYPIVHVWRTFSITEICSK